MRNYGPDEIREHIAVPLRDLSVRFSEVAKQLDRLLRAGTLQRDYIPASDAMFLRSLVTADKLLKDFERKMVLAQEKPKRVWREEELAIKRERYAAQKAANRSKRKRKAVAL